MENQKVEEICSNCKYFKPEGLSLYGLFGKCRSSQSATKNTFEDRTCEGFKELNPDEKCPNISESCESCEYLGTVDTLRFGRIAYCEKDKDDGRQPEKVHHPTHYCEGRKYEPIKVIQDWDLDFSLGSAVKYIARAGRKDDTVQDLQKAIQYLEFEIERIKEKQEDVHDKD